MVVPVSGAGTPVTVVMPTYNEATTLPRTAAALLALPLPGLRLLVVDDNSPDGTGEIADGLAKRHPERVEVLHRPAKSGLGRAYAAGLGHALRDGDARYLLQMDADGSHAVADVPRLLGAALSSGAGLVVGSRYVPGGRLAADWSAHRRLLSRWANRYLTAVLRGGPRDITAGFVLWRADTLRALGPAPARSVGYGFQVELKYAAVRAGCPVVEIPIGFAGRLDGASKLSAASQLEAALLPWRLLLGRPRGSASVPGRHPGRRALTRARRGPSGGAGVSRRLTEGS
ncbi:glycosyltransferase [Streptomyces profundus]|uniref:glycosyltransferase n=1 Tax=Streptomyces profundus TaxID=2867410 RepID=UPI001D163458|nr:glycosyltransferase [Streptomyces sp. MA3_2.13]UED86033.1 glycosyltransferase [Streptomyces sp. MA3_2.13]